MPVAILCGLDFAGKTSIALWLQTFSREVALRTTASTEIESVKKKDLVIFVIPGHRRYRFCETFYQTLFPMMDVLVFVVDAADKKRFDEAKEYFAFVGEMIKKYSKKKVKVTLCAHKQDLADAVSGYYLKKVIAPRQNDIKVLETSIKDEISMINLLRVIYGERKLDPFDVIIKQLVTKTKAKGAFIADETGLPLAIYGDEADALTFLVDALKFYNERENIDYLVTGANGQCDIVIYKRYQNGLVYAGVLGIDGNQNIKEVVNLMRVNLDYVSRILEKRWV